MWTVTILDYYHPSIFQFDGREEALDEYNKYKDRGELVILAKAELTNLSIDKPKDDGYTYENNWK